MSLFAIARFKQHSMATDQMGRLAWKGRGMDYAVARKCGGRWQEHQEVDASLLKANGNSVATHKTNKRKTLLPQSNSKRLAHH
jgi:hypothetical protein